MLLNIEKTKIVRIFATFSLLTYTIYYFGSYIGFFENYLIFFGKDDRFGDIFKLIYSFLHLMNNKQPLFSLNHHNVLSGQ